MHLTKERSNRILGSTPKWRKLIFPTKKISSLKNPRRRVLKL
jgi:hypothetical protein